MYKTEEIGVNANFLFSSGLRLLLRLHLRPLFLLSLATLGLVLLSLGAGLGLELCLGTHDCERCCFFFLPFTGEA